MSDFKENHGAEEEKNLQVDEDAYHYMLLNTILLFGAEEMVGRLMSGWQVKLKFHLEKFRFCLTGLKKTVYYGVCKMSPEDYAKVFARFRRLVEGVIERRGYRADVFMVFEEDAKQMAILFSPGECPQCTPEELAEEIDALGQDIYEEEIFKGDTRYCNVTALSEELHGYAGIREGYLRTRKCNDLSFFHMERGVITGPKVKKLRNRADYRVVLGECRQLQQALDEGDAALCKRRLETLFLKTVKGSCRWTLLQDTLSYCKHMLELRCTVRELEGIDLETLCDPASYLRIEECVEALWPVLERLCALTAEQGPYQELMLRAVYYIKLHFAEDLALTDVARYADMNPNYLSVAFQREMGLSVREYITRERMEAAKALLAEKGLRVADVAERVGVHDVKYFSRLFKKAVGLTPGEYREKQRGSRRI